MRVTLSSTSFKCYGFALVGMLGSTAAIASMISNWKGLAGLIRFVFTFGGVQWAPAVVALVATSIMLGGWCSETAAGAKDRNMTAGRVLFLVACWVVGAVAFCFTVGDLDSITVFECTAAVIAGFGLFAPLFALFLERMESSY